MTRQTCSLRPVTQSRPRRAFTTSGRGVGEHHDPRRTRRCALPSQARDKVTARNVLASVTVTASVAQGNHVGQGGSVWDKRALMDAAAKLALREFLVRFRGYYLVSFQWPTADSASFRTSKMRIERPSRNSTVEEIRKIAKAPGNPYKDRISVGRAQNCDVVIRHASISKLHAHFRARPGGFDLTDLESKNHTVVNGERLLPAVASAVTDGDILQFGAIEVQLATAEAVYRWIHVP